MDQLCLDPYLLLRYERSVVAVKGLEKPQQLVSYHVYNVNKYEYRTCVHIVFEDFIKHMNSKALFFKRQNSATFILIKIFLARKSLKVNVADFCLKKILL